MHNDHEDGILLLEVNRMLRAGGYFAWAAQPVYKHELLLEEQWEGKISLNFIEVDCSFCNTPSIEPDSP